MSEFLKCDSTGCDHTELVDSIVAEMVGKPCPKCGANLLTQSDWDYYESAFKPAMEAMKSLGLMTSAKPGEAGAVRVNYHNRELSIRLPASPLPSQQG